MPSSRAVQTLVLMPDPRQTPLGESRGAAVERAAHTPYGHGALGQLAARTGFNGQLREPHGGYQLGNGHRLYNPALMRFHSPDRLSPFDEGGLNAYAYCLGDPVNFTDPGGRFVMELPSLVMGSLFDHPIASLVHNSALIVGALMLNIVAPPAGAAAVASAATLLGSGMSIAGNIMQFAGEKEVGGKLATVGTTISSVASTVRVSLAWDKLREMGPMTAKGFWKKTKDSFAGAFKKPVAPAAKPVVNDVSKHEKLFEAAQKARRDSSPGLLPTQTQASFKPVAEAGDLPGLANSMREPRRVSMFGFEMGAPGPYQNMDKRRLSVHFIRE